MMCKGAAEFTPHASLSSDDVNSFKTRIKFIYIAPFNIIAIVNSVTVSKTLVKIGKVVA
jgi:hypothetical protein